jgi:hypothetical protein
MAIVEPKKESFSWKPLALGLAVILILGGIGLGVYKLIRGPERRTITLRGEDAKKAEASDNYRQPPPGPPMPPSTPIAQAPDPGATMVSLELKNVTPQEAIAALSKQTNIDINSGNQNHGQGQGFLAALLTQRINVSVNNQPFWIALREVCKQAKISPNLDYQSRNRISLVGGERSEMKCPAVSAGSSLVVLRSVTSTFHADILGVRPPQRNLNVALVLFAEPKISPYRISRVATIETAVDDKGNNLVRANDMWSDRNGGGNQSSWMSDVNCNLKYPEDNPGEKITRLKGYATIAIAGKDETVTIPDPLNAKNVDKAIDATNIRLVSFRKTGGNNYEARFNGDANSPVFKEWDRFSKIATVVDTSGKKFNAGGGFWGGVNRGTFEFGTNFTPDNGAGEPKEMKITLPTQIKEIRVPFDFTDIPLPS